MKIINHKYSRLIFTAVIVLFSLSACTKGDIKNTYCGIHINYQYCKCAFHNEFCDNIGMSKGEAKKHVYGKYDEWKNGDNDKEFEDDCREDNSFVVGSTCIKCGHDEIVDGNKCVMAEEGESEEESDDEKEEGECKYDSDCDPVCEGDTAWKMGCNARTDTCEKTFDNDCSADIEVFGNLDFAKICQTGKCTRDTDSIEASKAILMGEAVIWSDTVKAINAVRLELSQAMLDANKNCLNGIADMTNLAIVEFASRVGNVLAGGIPDVAAMTASAASTAGGLLTEHVKNLASAAVDYAGFGVEKLKAYQQGVPTEEEKKLKPHEYIKLNCDLYQYFKGVQAESDAELQMALDNANEVDRLYKELP